MNTAKRGTTHHCADCGAEVLDSCTEHPKAEIDSISTLLASDGTRLGVGVRVEGGKPGTEDYDTGRVVEVEGDHVWVGWDTCVRTRAHASQLRGQRGTGTASITDSIQNHHDIGFNTAIGELEFRLRRAEDLVMPNEHVESQQIYLSRLRDGIAKLRAIIASPLVALLLLMSSCTCDEGPKVIPAPHIEDCRPAPAEANYPTLQAWRDDAVIWMICARFTCTEVIVKP